MKMVSGRTPYFPHIHEDAETFWVFAFFPANFHSFDLALLDRNIY
jgi:hypothetical protein